MGKDLRIKSNTNFDKKSIIAIAVATMLFFLLILGIYAKVGSNEPLLHSQYDSYTLQAMAWREGKAELDENYLWLELALVNDEYFATHDKDDYESYREVFGDVNEPAVAPEGSRVYVSFPPVPSVTMYFLSFVFGENTPSALVSILYTVTAFLFAMLTLKKLNLSTINAIGVSALGIISSSVLFLACNKIAGGVWFQAQTMALMLTMIAFYCIFSENKITNYFAFAFLALAVGARPFQILYFVFFAYIIAKKYDFKIFKTWSYYISPAVIGGCYMAYNYHRFGDPFEFGHNYLPEFMRSPEGQFGLAYFKDNFNTAFKELPKIENGEFVFSRFGFAFYASNVIFAALAVLLLMNIIRTTYNGIVEKKMPDKNMTTYAFILVLLLATHLFLLMLHKTWGGWQFGSRYVCDLIPAAIVLFGVLFEDAYAAIDKYNKKYSFYVNVGITAITFAICLAVFAEGVLFNINGVIKLF